MFSFPHSLLSDITYTYVLTCTNSVNHFPFHPNRFWVTSAQSKKSIHIMSFVFEMFKYIYIAVIIITPFKTVTDPTQNRLDLYSFRSDFWVIRRLNRATGHEIMGGYTEAESQYCLSKAKIKHDPWTYIGLCTTGLGVGYVVLGWNFSGVKLCADSTKVLRTKR